LVLSNYRRRFPFLIGRIRTVNPFEMYSGDHGFPFLIGRIRTGRYYPLLEKGTGFPFLIGRIRTRGGPPNP